MIPQQHRNKAIAGSVVAAAISLAAVSIYNDEGERHNVYRDIVGVPTYCIGETKNPNWNHVYTHTECMTILEGRLPEFEKAVERCITVDMGPARLASLINFAYNLGGGALCHEQNGVMVYSTIARRLNAGDANACDAMMLYDRAGGKVSKGLHDRRARNRKQCMEG